MMDIHPFPKVIAHRGASAYAPENTIAAMIKAHDLHIPWVEFDVMLSQDGEPIIIHDTRLDRTTSGSGEVAENDLKTICTLDAGSWFAADFCKQRVPTLKQMLQCLREYNLKAIIEIKPYPKFETLTAEKTVEVLVKYWGDKLENTILSSFSIKSLQAVRRLAPQQKLGLGIHHWRDNYLETISRLDCASVHVNQHILSLPRIEKLKKCKKILLSYTVNDLAQAQKLFNLGIDGVFSDYPDKLILHNHNSGNNHETI